MERIIELYEQRNHYLEKFYSINENEIQRMTTGNFDNVNNFYQSRDGILNIINYIDTQLGSEQEKALTHLCDDGARQQLKEQLDIKNEYVLRILDQDLAIISLIEKEKANVLKDLQEVRRNRKAVSGYKTYVPNVQLNEEA